MAPSKHIVSVPETIDFSPSDTTMSRRSGHMVESPAIMMPSEPKLAKPLEHYAPQPMSSDAGPIHSLAVGSVRQQAKRPPAAITGIFTASTTCGTSAIVPTAAPRRLLRNVLGCPPASKPCAITASQPRASSQRASSTVVADERIFAPVPFIRSTNLDSGSPKWKLTTSGLSSTTRSHRRLSNGDRGAPAVCVSSSPSSV